MVDAHRCIGAKGSGGPMALGRNGAELPAGCPKPRQAGHRCPAWHCRGRASWREQNSIPVPPVDRDADLGRTTAGGRNQRALMRNHPLFAEAVAVLRPASGYLVGWGDGSAVITVEPDLGPAQGGPPRRLVVNRGPGFDGQTCPLAAKKSRRAERPPRTGRQAVPRFRRSPPDAWLPSGHRAGCWPDHP